MLQKGNIMTLKMVNYELVIVSHSKGIVNTKRSNRTSSSQFGSESNFASYDSVYNGTATEQEREELDNYFQKKYFKNKDFFKYKVDETDPWNLTKKLYNKYADKKDAEKENYVLFHEYSHRAYYEHKDDLKFSENRHVLFGVLYDYKYLIFGGILLAGIFGFGQLYLQSKKEPSNENKGKSPQLSAR